MALLRPIKKNQTTTEMYASQVHIEEGEEYEVAKKMFEEDKDILYFFYFNDKAEKRNGFYTYPIEKSDVKLYFSQKERGLI